MLLVLALLAFLQKQHFPPSGLHLDESACVQRKMPVKFSISEWLKLLFWFSKDVYNTHGGTVFFLCCMNSQRGELACHALDFFFLFHTESTLNASLMMLKALAYFKSEFLWCIVSLSVLRNVEQVTLKIWSITHITYWKGKEGRDDPNKKLFLSVALPFEMVFIWMHSTP